MTKINSPCVRNCCLDTKDICLGCFRSIGEILVWSKVNTTSEQKHQIIQNSKDRRSAYQATYKIL